eukprot:TRINITY_DN26746_c0_g1_i2.p1 TRINITY_DN26746_c0_g1~~TRINITY_DN26746_c0_g1_i2.p1  ORF type:complete len:240 (-),score=0.88 TRINITY_DN26746_c0_g1_i2:108-827(-)
MAAALSARQLSASAAARVVATQNGCAPSRPSQSVVALRQGDLFATPATSLRAVRSFRPAVASPSSNSVRKVRVAASSSSVDVEPAKQSGSDDTWQWKLLYDGDCPICVRNSDFLKARNEGRGTLKFVNIADLDYDPEENEGVTYEDAMGTIHGISRSGEVVTGVEAMRKFYDAVGLGWVVQITTFPPVAMLADAVYALVAKYRLPLAGHPSLQAILDERRRTVVGYKGCSEDEPCEAEY